MGIEFFTENRRGFAPKVSIRKHGQIGLNQGALVRYKIESGKFAVLGYDRDQGLVVIKVTDDREEPGAREIVVRASGGSISAKPFLDYFEIPYEKTRRYELSHDEGTGCLQFSLSTD